MAMLVDQNGLFVFKSDHYIYLNLTTQEVEDHLNITQMSFNIPFSTIDAALRWDDTIVFFFKGMDCIKYDTTKKSVVPGYPKKIIFEWKGIWPSDLSDAIKIGDKVFFFRRTQYISYDVLLGKPDTGYPKSIADGWPGVWGSIDGAEYMGQDKVLFLNDGEVILYDLKRDRADTGYPISIHSYLESYKDHTTSNNIDTAVPTIHAYVSAIITAKKKITANYLSAIDNFDTLIQSTAPSAEIQPHALSSVLQIGLATIEKIIATTLKEPIGSALQPIMDLIHRASNTISTAPNHALSGTEWMGAVRRSLTNLFAEEQSVERLNLQLESAYELYDKDTRDRYITSLKNEMPVLQTLEFPSAEQLELAIYTAWINQNVDGEGIDDTGHIDIRLIDGGNRSSATVQAPLGDQIAAALNGIMDKAGITHLADLDTVKKVSKGDIIAYFERDNSLRSNPMNNDSAIPFMLDDSWKSVERFTT